MQKIITVGFLTAILTLAAAETGAADRESDSSVSRQADVVRAVGVVRYFHPHDAGTEIDWNRVLMDGFRSADGESDDTTFAGALAAPLYKVAGGISHQTGADAVPPATGRGSDRAPSTSKRSKVYFHLGGSRHQVHATSAANSV